MRPSRGPAPLIALALSFAASPALAHISLDVPKGRYWNAQQQETDQTKQKQGPCGVANDKRTTDPSLITTYRAGQTITVEWTETVPHAGHYRIAFLQNGQDFPVPTRIEETPMPPVLVDGIPDPSGGKSEFSAEVTLPSVECTNCTLQLIQVMKTAPPYAASDLYFQCADLILTGNAAGTGGAAGGPGTTGGRGGAGPSSGGGAGAPAGGSGGATPMGGAAGSNTGGSSGSSASAGSPGAGGALGGAAGSQGIVFPPAGAAGAAGSSPSASGAGGSPTTAPLGGATSAGAPASGAGFAGSSAAPAEAEEDSGGCSVHTPSRERGLGWLGLSVGLWLALRRASQRRAGESRRP